MTACRLLPILPSSRAARAVMAMFLLLRVDTSGSSSVRGEDEGRATSGTYGQEDEGRWGEVGVRKKPSAFVINKDAR